MGNPSRRQVLLGGAAAAAALAAPRSWLRSCWAADPPHVRKSVTALAPDAPDLVALRAGVQAMKARPNTDRTGWVAQARLHLEDCAHNNWFILPWHRGYVHAFEAVCRAASGMPEFSLPYWDWTSAPALPDPFRDPDSSLFDSDRGTFANQPIDAEIVGQAVLDQVLETPDFETFGSGPASTHKGFGGSGTLEGGPHNGVHGWLGYRPSPQPPAHMGTYWSPLDPIFWLHHCNIDRLWSRWAQMHANPTDPAWLAYRFDRFVDGTGMPRPYTVSEVLDSRALGYVYDTDPPVVTPPEPEPMTFRRMGATERTATVFGRVPLSVPVPLTEGFTPNLGRLAAPARGTPRLKIRIEGVEPPPVPNFRLRVFLNCPYLSPDTPPTDPHHVATLSFFEDPSAHAETGDAAQKGRTLVVDASRTFGRLVQAGEIRAPKDTLQVQLVAVPIEGTQIPNAALKPSKVEVLLGA